MTQLLDVVPTIQFGRKRTLHGYKLNIVSGKVRLFTRCGTDATDAEHTVTHGIVTCDDCLGVTDGQVTA